MGQPGVAGGGLATPATGKHQDLVTLARTYCHGRQSHYLRQSAYLWRPVTISPPGRWPRRRPLRHDSAPKTRTLSHFCTLEHCSSVSGVHGSGRGHAFQWLGQEGLSWPLTDQDARLGARVAGIQLSSLAFAFEGLQSDGCVPHRQQLQARNDGNVARSRSSALYIGGPTWKKVWKVTSCPRPSPTWAFPHPYWYGHHPLFCCGGGSHRYPTVGSLHSQPPPPKIHERVLRKDGVFLRPPLFSFSSLLLKAQLEGIL